MSWLCIHPWSQLNITPSGSIRLCCHQKDNNGSYDNFGNIKTDSIEEIFNGPGMRRVRRQMLKGEAPPECRKCVMIEKMQSRSPRQREFGVSYSKDVLDNYVTTTQEDGTADYDLKFWDLRFSNICNMACVMCNGEWSSLWINESKEYIKGFSQEHIEQDSNLNYMQWQHKFTDNKVNQTKDFKWIDNHMDQVERIYFAGGEPMIMPSHWYILEKLHSNKRFDVEVSYNINTLKLSHQGKNAIDYWKDWPYKKVKVQPSIDETEERAEWIRYGTIWKTVKQNLIDIRDAGIWMQPLISVGAYNLLRLPQLIDELTELIGNKVQLNIVYNREWHFSNLNCQDRIKVKSELEKRHNLIADPGKLKEIYHVLDCLLYTSDAADE